MIDTIIIRGSGTVSLTADGVLDGVKNGMTKGNKLSVETGNEKYSIGNFIKLSSICVQGPVIFNSFGFFLAQNVTVTLCGSGGEVVIPPKHYTSINCIICGSGKVSGYLNSATVEFLTGNISGNGTICGLYIINSGRLFIHGDQGNVDVDAYDPQKQLLIKRF